MAEKNLGGVSWYVDADTSPAVKSIGEFDRVVSSAEGKLAKMDDATKKATIVQAKLEHKTNLLTAALRKQGNVIASNGVVIDKYGQVNERATRTLSKFNAEQIKLSKTSVAVSNGLSGIGRGAGQAGIQMQQFIGQVQGGQSVMLALSQQSADLGFVLGAPLLGAVVGISASLIGMLLPNLMKTTDAIEEVEKVTENLRAAMTLSADGVTEYSEKMLELRNISKSLFDVKISILLAEQQIAMKKAAEGVNSYVDEFRGLNYAQDLFGNRSSAAVKSFIELSDAANSFESNQSVKNFNRLENALKSATDAGLNNTEAGVKLAGKIIDLSVAFKQGETRIKALSETVKDGSAEFEGASNSVDKYQKLADSLSTRVFKLRSESLAHEKALTLEKAAQDGVSESVRNSIAASFDKMIANAKESESERDKAKALRETQKARRENARAQREANKEEAAQDKRRRESAKRAKRIGEGVDFAKDVVGRGIGESPEIAQFRDEQEKLDNLREQGLISEQLYQDALTQSRRDGEMARQQITAAALGTFAGSFDQLAAVFKNAEGEQSASFKAMFALSKGFAIAQAGLNLSKAISDAMAWGGLTLPEKIASASAVAAAGAQVASSISSATYSGREHGGSVMAGQTYEVGEKNKPELLMIPGNNGKVFSNSEMKSMMNGGGGGGGGAPIINVHNYSGANVDARASQDPVTRQDVIDIMIGQTGNTNSRVMRNITSNTTANNISAVGGRR